MYENSKPQWTMTVTVYHGPTFGHAVELVTETRGRPAYSTHDSIGSWHGIGIPEEVMDQMETMVVTAFQQHMYQRYGVTQTLLGWEAEPEPF